MQQHVHAADAQHSVVEVVAVEGEGHIELDGELVPVKPMTSVLIKPGCRHRTVGDLRIVNVSIPSFDPADEWFDD